MALPTAMGSTPVTTRDQAEAVLQVGLARTNGLHLGDQQFKTRLQGLQDVLLMAGKRLSANTFDLPVLPLGRLVVLHLAMVFNGSCLLLSRILAWLGTLGNTGKPQIGST